MWTAYKRGAPISFGNAVVGVDGQLLSFGGDKQFDDEYDGLEGLLSVAILNTYYLEFRHILYREMRGVPFDRSEATAVKYGNKVYVWGGRSQDGGFFYDTLLCFDTDTRSWSFPETSGDVPVARAEHGAGVANDAMYVFGGQSSRGVNFPNSHVYKLDLLTKAWSVIRAGGATVSVAYARAVVTLGGRIYVLDASTDSDYITISYFDTVREIWVKLSNDAPPTSRTGYCAWAYKGCIFMFGGSNSSVFSNELWRYSLENNTWGLMTVGGKIPPPISGACCAIIEDKVYVFGGAIKGRNGSVVCNENLHVFEYVPGLQTLCIMRIYEDGLSPAWLPNQLLTKISIYYDNMRSNQFFLYN